MSHHVNRLAVKSQAAWEPLRFDSQLSHTNPLFMVGQPPAGRQRGITSFFAKSVSTKAVGLAEIASKDKILAAKPSVKSEQGHKGFVNCQGLSETPAATIVPAKGSPPTESVQPTASVKPESQPVAPLKLKRLRKLEDQEESPRADKRSATAAKLDNDLEDEVATPASTAATGVASSPTTCPEEVPANEAAKVAPQSNKSRKRVKKSPAKDAAVSKAAAMKESTPKAQKQKKANASAALSDSPAPSRTSSGKAPQGEDSEAESSPKTAALKPVKKAILKHADPKAKVEGVGHGSVAAAAKHKGVDLKQIITWNDKPAVPFSFLAQTFEEVAETSGRLDIQNILCNSLRAILATHPQDLLPTVYLCTGRVAPSHAGIELGVGDSILIKALAEATGRQVAQINKQYGEEGDLGIVAASARGKQNPIFKPAPLTIAGVHKVFLEIASTQGNKSTEKKKALINKLLVAASSSEAGYIMRALQGKLRIGLGEQAVLNSIGFASYLHFDGGKAVTTAMPSADATSPAKAKKSKDDDLSSKLEAAAQAVKLAFSQCPSYDVLIPALLADGPMDIANTVRFQLGVPVKPMLAKPMTGVSEVLDKFSDKPFTCEYKYDGERAQVHVLPDGKVHIYSRNSEDNTGKYPDVVANIPKLVKSAVTGGIVLDCEAVAYDREDGIILPFQVLSTRARKGVKVEDIKVQVCLYAFDCLYLNGEALIQKPLTERRAALYNSIEEKPGELMYASTKESHDLEELTLFLTDSVTAGTEGLIIKSLDSTYEPSRRSAHWLKLKKDYMDSVGDTFDVVPIGAWFGKGKRKGVYGAYLLAIYNEEKEQFQSISKIGTGFSEQLLTDLSASLEPTIIPAAKSYYLTGGSGAEAPDVWFDTTQVWEVKAADLSISPRHMAAYGMLTPDKGISIRFPRLVRVRDDKDPEQATSADQVMEMYKAQAIVGQSSKKTSTADEDY